MSLEHLDWKDYVGKRTTTYVRVEVDKQRPGVGHLRYNKTPFSYKLIKVFGDDHYIFAFNSQVTPEEDIVLFKMMFGG